MSLFSMKMFCSRMRSPFNVHSDTSVSRQSIMTPVTSLMRAHCQYISSVSPCLLLPVLTSTGFPDVNFRTSSSRLRSHRSTWPSEEADIKLLKDLETASIVTEDLCPNRVILGCRSIAFESEMRTHIEIVQSVPAVIRVLESAKIAYEIWPWWTCSNRPIS